MTPNDPLISSMLSHLENLRCGLENGIAIQRAQNSMDQQAESRYAENLELFRELFPNIYKHYVNYKPEGKFKLICNDNGEPNLVDLRTHKLLYTSSPFDECRKKVEYFLEKCYTPFQSMNSKNQEKDSIGQLHMHIRNTMCQEVEQICSQPSDMRKFDSIPTMFMFGLGLGYQLGYLYERMTPLNLFIVEPDEELFYHSLHVFDYGSLFSYLKKEQLGISFYLLTDADDFVANVNSYLLRHAGATLPQLAMFFYNSDVMSAFIDKIRRDFNTLVHTSGFFDDMIFGMSHSIDHILRGIPALKNCRLPAQIAEKPIVVVGNGPSLDDDIDLLAKYQDRCAILACGTAFSALCKRGIKADIYVAVERTLDVYDALMEIRDHREYFDETLCLALDVVHPKVYSLFKRRILIVKGNEVMPTWLAANRMIGSEVFFITRTNPLVANLGLEIASKLGFRKIYLLGLDNGAAGEKTHSENSLYFDENKELKEQYRNMMLDKMPFEMPGNFVPTVRTNLFFKLAVRVMEQTVNTYEKDSSYFNCSNGMRINKCQPLHFSDIDWENAEPWNKSLIPALLFSAGTVRIRIDPGTIRQRFQIGNFKSALDQIYNDWEKAPATRAEFVLKEESQSGYLLHISKTGLIGAIAVNSSLAMFFNYVNKVLYYFQDEQKSIELAHRILRKYMLKFFTGCKIIYEHILEYHLGYHKDLFADIVRQIDEINPEEMLSEMRDLEPADIGNDNPPA